MRRFCRRRIGRMALPLLFLAISGVIAGKKPSGKKMNQETVGTVSNIQELNTLIGNTRDRLLIFDLYADWCLPCRVLSPMLEKIAADHRNKVSVYKINIDKSPDIARAFGVTGIPYVVYVMNQKAVHALTGVQSKETYVRAIERFALPETATATTPDGELVEGVRIIRLNTATTPGDLYVYRGETVKIVIDEIDIPYSIHIPGFGVSKTGEVGKKLEVSFKAEETGVYPIFCNGKCPSGDGSNYGRIIVVQYASSGKALFSELSVDETVRLIEEKKPLILDVRTPNEFYKGRIEGAMLLPLQQLEERISELAGYKDREILVYCRSGNRSIVASQILINHGFGKLYHLRPGIVGWEKEGRKLVND